MFPNSAVRTTHVRIIPSLISMLIYSELHEHCTSWFFRLLWIVVDNASGDTHILQCKSKVKHSAHSRHLWLHGTILPTIQSHHIPRRISLLDFRESSDSQWISQGWSQLGGWRLADNNVMICGWHRTLNCRHRHPMPHRSTCDQPSPYINVVRHSTTSASPLPSSTTMVSPHCTYCDNSYDFPPLSTQHSDSDA